MFEGATFLWNKRVCKAKNRGSFSDKSHKNRGHLGTFFSNSSQLGVFKWKISKILDGEWRTPYFQQKWKGGHNEISLWQLLFIHSLVVCSVIHLNFVVKISKKTCKWLCLLFCHVALIEQHMKIRSRADVKYSCKYSLIPVCNNEVLTLVL